MPVICVLAAAWGVGGTEEAGRKLLEAGVVPRVAVEESRLWGDVGGVRLDQALVELRLALGAVRCGVADTPVAAFTAAVGACEDATVVVPAGTDRAFLAPLPLGVLEPEERLESMLEAVGIGTCGELAAVPQEAVEVRFGGEAVGTWRLARADDPRRLFRRIPPERPHASLDFMDYVVTSPEQLLFTTNALLGHLCAGLSERGEHARSMKLELPLANGERWSRVLRAARPTASRAAWLRLARSVLERLTVPDAVAGVELCIQSTEAATAVQGDLFDAGFATASSVEAALARLLETQGPVLVTPDVGDHPLPERRTEYQLVEIEAMLRQGTSPLGAPPALRDAGSALGLTLQLLTEPRPVLVESIRRRDHIVPIRYRDEQWKQLTTVAGPDRISGGVWEEAYAREYYRGVTVEGTLVLLYRDARRDTWYLHGWWD
jgi:protein ImuB